jgi:hypothetical protein
MVAIVGIGGIGTAAHAARMAHHLAPRFGSLFWGTSAVWS